MRTLEWRSPLSFTQSIFTRDSDSLPVYSERIPWTGTINEQPRIVLSNLVYEPVTGNQEEIARIAGKITAGEPVINTFIQVERKQPFVRYSFIPIRRNSSTGQLERLIRFSAELQKDGTQVSMKKSTPSIRQYTSRSVLADGQWYKIRVARTGIQKLSYEELKSLGLKDPSQVRIYGNGGRQLPYSSNQERVDDLAENQVYLMKGSDNVFNEGDYLLFYGQSTTTWKYDAGTATFSHRLHLYSDDSYYFLTESLGAGRKINSLGAVTLTPQSIVTEYDAYDYREKDSLNLIKSGRQWCWTHFAGDLSWGYDFSFPNHVESEPVKITAALWARSPKTSPNSVFYVKNEDSPITFVQLAGVHTNNSEALFASSAISRSQFVPAGDDFTLKIQFVPSNPAGEGWLDYLIVNTRCKLAMTGAQLSFRDARAAGSGKVVKFQVAGASTDHLIWDVTDPADIRQVSTTAYTGGLEFTATAERIREYIAFDPASDKLLNPVVSGDALGQVENQNLHGLECPEMVILVHDDLKSYAQEIAAIHQEHEGLDVLMVSPQQVYNEFSSGIPDATAIRDFLKMFYDRSAAGSFRLKYVLFFGDGSYDNKTFLKDYPTCLPTYQSLESLYPTSSYVTDDFFGLLDSGEDLEPGLLDVGIGRIPVMTENEASIVLGKISQYYSSESLGDWRNLICFIGDDEDGNSHMRDANTLADLLSNQYPAFNTEKIFLDAYEQLILPAGERYPEVNRAINDRMKKGALIMNYLGHGSERGLAHEEVVTITDIKSWSNPDRFPLFISATCEFSRYDDANLVSAGEWVLLNPSGGGISLLSTTRLVYSSPNFILNREFYNYVFKKDGTGKRYTLGDIIRLTKNAVGEEMNKLNFTLLGDPALTLRYPEMGIVMTEINSQPVEAFTDTLKALSHTTIKGRIIDLEGNKLESFNGTVVPTVYDKEFTQTNLANDGGPVMEFVVRNSILFRGRASVVNGEFTSNFPVPKDIAYKVGTGKFSFYADNGETDAQGVNLGILIGGSEGTVVSDNTGPVLELFLNDTSFVNGGLTGESPALLVRIRDSSGINTTGNGIGHDITAIIDDKQQNSTVLNDYYESDLDDYRSGSIRYPLNKLEEGDHNIRVKVWDIVNNSTEARIDFTVRNSDELVLDHVLNYPNPFTTRTDFYFEHNQGDQTLDVLIQIFTLSGKLVKSFEFLTADQTQVEAGSFRVGPVTWDGLDDFGDRIGRGTYFYRVKVKTADGKTKEAYQKLVILK